MNDKVKISVVMSVYNAERYLKLAIESILGQTFTEFEFIIINDGSVDGSLKEIEAFSDNRIVLVNQSNTGLAKALNIGIEKSRSNLIARMDADDVALPDRFHKQYSFLMQNLDYVIVGSNAKTIDKDGNHIYNSSLPINDSECKKGLPITPFIHPSIMFRRNAFYEAGKYPEQMLTGQDYVLINRMAKLGKFFNIEEPLMKYRIVPNSNSFRSNKNKRVMEILNKAIENNNIPEDDYTFLKLLVKQHNSINHMYSYHILLAKKYLWNNYQPKLARSNLSESLKISLSLYALMLYAASYFPSKMIDLLYNLRKSF